jgi:hypothetical protein
MESNDRPSGNGTVWTPLGNVVVTYDAHDEKVTVAFEADDRVRSRGLVMNDGKPVIEVSRVREME